MPTIFLCAVYDVTKRSSFLSLERWIEEVRRYTASNVMLVLIGKHNIFGTLNIIALYFGEKEF